MDIAIIIVHLVMCQITDAQQCIDVNLQYKVHQRTFTSVNNISCKGASEWIKAEVEDWFERPRHKDWSLKEFYCREVGPYREH